MTSGQKNILVLELRAADMRNVDGAFGRKNASKNRLMKRLDRLLAASDPFFEVYNARDEIVARSEVIMDNLNPKWPALHIDLKNLCQLDLDQEINISFHDWEKDGDHVFMGNITTSVQELIGKASNSHGTSSRRSIRKQEPSFRISVRGKEYGKIYVVKAHTAWGTAHLVHAIDGIAAAVDEIKHMNKTRGIRKTVESGSPKSTEEGFEVVVGTVSSVESSNATDSNPPSSPRNIATASSTASPIGGIATERSIEWDDGDFVTPQEESAPLGDDSGSDAEALLQQAEQQRAAKIAAAHKLAQQQQEQNRLREKEQEEQQEARRIAAEEDVQRKIATEEKKLRIAQEKAEQEEKEKEEHLRIAKEQAELEEKEKEELRLEQERARLEQEAQDAEQRMIEQDAEQKTIAEEEEEKRNIAEKQARIRREEEEMLQIAEEQPRLEPDVAQPIRSRSEQEQSPQQAENNDTNPSSDNPVEKVETDAIKAPSVSDEDGNVDGQAVPNGPLDDDTDAKAERVKADIDDIKAAPSDEFAPETEELMDAARARADVGVTKDSADHDVSHQLNEDAQITSNRVLEEAGLGIIEDSTMTDILVLEMWATDVKNVDGMFGEQMDFDSSSSERLMSRVTGFFGASDPYFEVANSRDRIVARSKVMMDNLNPKWPPIHINLEALCHKKLEKPVYLTFYDFESDRKPQFLGHVKTSVEEILMKADECKRAGETAQEPSFRITVEHEEYGKVYVVDAKVSVGVPDALQEAKDQFILPEGTFVQSEARRLSDEAEARQLAELEAKRLAKEEAKKAAEREKKRLEGLETKRLAELEAKRLEEEAKRRQAEAAEKRRLEELEAQRLAELEEKRLAEEAEKAAAEKRRLEELETKRIAELEEKRRAEQAEKEAADKRRFEELEAKRLAEAAEMKRKAEAAERKRQEALEAKLTAEEAEKKKNAEAAERKRLEELKAKRTAEEAEKKKKAEAAERKRLEELEAKRIAEEADKRKKAEAAEKRRQEELEAKRLAGLEAKRREEEAKKAAEAEQRRLKELEAKRCAEEEAARKAAEEERRRKEEKRRREEAARMKAENNAKRQEELERQRKEDEEAARLRAEERAHRFADEETKRKAAAFATKKRIEDVMKQTEMDAAARAAEEARLREEREALVAKRRAEAKEAKMRHDEVANQKAREAAQRVAQMRAKEKARAAGLDTSVSPRKSPHGSSSRGDVFERLYKQDTTSCAEKRVNRHYFDT